MATEPDLIERSAAEEAIRDALRSGARGDGIAALLVGPSGIGKTAVLNWATQLAREEGSVCLGRRS